MPLKENLGASDPDYAAFLDRLDAQKNFIKKLEIYAHLRTYVFYPRGHLLHSDSAQPMPDDGRLDVLQSRAQINSSKDGRHIP